MNKNFKISCPAKEHVDFLKKQKRRANFVRLLQVAVLMIGLSFWEFAARANLIDSFLVSSPSRILRTILELNSNGQLWENVIFTVTETIMGFTFGTVLGILIAIIIWWSPLVCKVSQPYLVVFNALPKVALGPIVIVWIGANMTSIIVMALLVSVIISIINVLAGFQNVDREKILLMKSFGANK
ncbi:MAG: ABC transporter permease subunit, partial [Oscillospiraceae bacterium]|nr:ABC transporter permease subunit [Oscillospiraceae bacterium]